MELVASPQRVLKSEMMLYQLSNVLQDAYLEESYLIQVCVSTWLILNKY